MAGQTQYIDPFYEDWTLFDPSETDLDLEPWPGCPVPFVEGFSSYPISLPSDSLDGTGSSQYIDILVSKHGDNNKRDLFDNNIGDPLGRTSSFLYPPLNSPQPIFSASAPELYSTMTDIELASTIRRPTVSNSSSIMSEPYTGPWQSSPPSEHKLAGPNNKHSSDSRPVEFIQYTLDKKTNKMKKFDPNANSRKGRKGKLTNEQRRDAGRMRKLGACASCRERREKVKDGQPLHPTQC